MDSNGNHGRGGQEQLMGSLWKWVGASSTGTSHLRREETCQDSSHVVVVSRGEASTLLVACADGAGSASHSGPAARLSCQALIHLGAEFVRGGGAASHLTREIVLAWYGRVRRTLSLEGCSKNVPLREYACTLLLAVVDESGAGFAQIGDGAIVIQEGDGYRPVFWPQSGEYANTTSFLSGENFAEQLMFSSLDQSPRATALFTDGLQPLALHYASRSAHAPFFRPMFEMLSRHPNPDELQEPLKNFLDSEAVNDRTDDDKTLILATQC
jgi:Protein phosphatase 2C